MGGRGDSVLRCRAGVGVGGIGDAPWVNGFRQRLTTVAQPVAAMGECAVRMLLERVEGGRAGKARTEVMTAGLRVRDSCGAPGG